MACSPGLAEFIDLSLEDVVEGYYERNYAIGEGYYERNYTIYRLYYLCIVEFCIVRIIV